MSSLICESAKCVFTRVDTDGHSYGIPEFPFPFPRPSENSTDDEDYYPFNDDVFKDDTVAPWTDEENQDMLSATVALTRDFNGGLFNAMDGDNRYNGYSPSGTRWALLPEGQTFEDARCSLRFCSWSECFAKGKPHKMLNQPGVVHLIKEDKYYNIMFTNWTHTGNDYYYRRNLKKAAQKSAGHGRRRLEEEGGENGDEEDFLAEMKEDENQNGEEHFFQSKDRGSIRQHYHGFNDDDNTYLNYNPEFGGGFQYIRDEEPIALDENLVACPTCKQAVAMPAVLTGPVDYKFQEVSIVGATPADAKITIRAVQQEQHLSCNTRSSNENDLTTVRPNAKGIGNSTAMLRRTRVSESINPFWYTIHYRATSDVGFCDGTVRVCSPLEGFGCDDHYYGGYDATATKYCMPYY